MLEAVSPEQVTEAMWENDIARGGSRENTTKTKTQDPGGESKISVQEKPGFEVEKEEEKSTGCLERNGKRVEGKGRQGDYKERVNSLENQRTLVRRKQ